VTVRDRNLTPFMRRRPWMGVWSGPLWVITNKFEVILAANGKPVTL
jgi:hypothetical protein